MPKSPIITVGMPVYNGEKYFREAISSVLNQTFDDFEILISDNASTDGTEEICREFARSDKRVHYHRNEKNVGAALNYNNLVHRARGEFFRWHNADDLIEPNSHELCLKVLKENPDAVLSFGKTRIIDGEGNLLQLYDDNIHLPDETPSARYKRFRKNVGQTNAIYGLMRTEALRKTHLFRKFQASDTNFMGELCLYGKFIQIPKYLFYRRIHEGASSWERKNKEVQRDFWDPLAEAFNFQFIKRHFVCYSDVFSADISRKEKIKIFLFLLRLTRYARVKIWQDFKYSLKHKI